MEKNITITLRMSEIDGILLKCFAEYNGETVSSYIRRVVMNDIEKEYRSIEKKYSNDEGTVH